MTDELELVRTYEPVLRFSKDAEGRPERFFPVAASHYVQESGLRRRGVGWEHPPGATRLPHLSLVPKPRQCYLSFAAGDLEDGDVVLKMLDQGLELSRPLGPAAVPGVSFDASPGESAVVPRLLVSRELADGLEEELSAWGGVERQPVGVVEMTELLGEAEEVPSRAAMEAAFGLSFAPGLPEGEAGVGAVSFGPEMAAPQLEWVVPMGFGALSESIHQRALDKYEPYRDWQAHPPVYHYHVVEDRGYRVLEYWFLYAYNDWAAHGGYNDHEGDWEVIYVFLDDRDRPRHVAYSRHVKIPWLYGPSTARWPEVERERWATGEATHPVVYVGCGSHASYLERDTYHILWLEDIAQGNDVAIGPGADQPWGDPVRLAGEPWNLLYSGKWGSLVKSWLGMVLPGTEGPTGPAQKRDKWDHPARWAGIVTKQHFCSGSK